MGKFICVGLNYADHAAESGLPVPAEPVLFMKTTSALIGCNDPVVLPKDSVKSDWEVELGVVIGSKARYVSEADALKHVAGYCVVNDLSEREYQLERGGQWDKGKGCDTFGPVGPWLVTRDEVADPQTLGMWLDVNGQRCQNGSTRTMVFGVATLVSYISRFMTLYPGDLISTGTPPGVGMGRKPPVFLKPGDEIRLGIEGLGEQRQAVHAHRDDDVVIARRQLVSGAELPDEGVIVSGLIPPGHKVAVRAIAAGSPVRRYNQIIGVAKQPIAAGQHVHSHNLEFSDFQRDYAVGQDARPTEFIVPAATFNGIVRADGRIATRNYIGVLTSVNCSATVARAIADHFRRDIRPEALAPYPNVDGVVALTHGGGCATDSEGEPLQVLRRTLGGYARHANFSAILVIGLGCETNQISGLMAQEGLSAGTTLHTFNIQETGGTSKTVAHGIELVQWLLEEANRVSRQPVSASHITVGLQCGGSDGYSGISANPALGAAVDLLVRHGGTAILSETPEIYGGEHLLTRRAASQAVADKLLARLKWWERYCERNDAEMDNNPSAGNKAGGLTTILEKSLGAIAKSGTTRLVDVVEYAQTVTAKGFVFMDTPGYDPVSATGQVAGGANLICFTTGRGSAYGCAPAPSLKLSTNTELWLKQEDDIDINCGTIIDGTQSIQQVGEAIFQRMLATASGERTKSELHGYGQSEFVPWQLGAVM